MIQFQENTQAIAETEGKREGQLEAPYFTRPPFNADGPLKLVCLEHNHSKKKSCSFNKIPEIFSVFLKFITEII